MIDSKGKRVAVACVAMLGVVLVHRAANAYIPSSSTSLSNSAWEYKVHSTLAGALTWAAGSGLNQAELLRQFDKAAQTSSYYSRTPTNVAVDPTLAFSQGAVDPCYLIPPFTDAGVCPGFLDNSNQILVDTVPGWLIGSNALTIAGTSSEQDIIVWSNVLVRGDQAWQSSGRDATAQSFKKIMSHELGHAYLGLGDMPGTGNPCSVLTQENPLMCNNGGTWSEMANDDISGSRHYKGVVNNYIGFTEGTLTGSSVDYVESSVNISVTSVSPPRLSCALDSSIPDCVLATTELVGGNTFVKLRTLTYGSNGSFGVTTTTSTAEVAKTEVDVTYYTSEMPAVAIWRGTNGRPSTARLNVANGNVDIAQIPTADWAVRDAPRVSYHALRNYYVALWNSQDHKLTYSRSLDGITWSSPALLQYADGVARTSSGPFDFTCAVHTFASTCKVFFHDTTTEPGNPTATTAKRNLTMTHCGFSMNSNGTANPATCLLPGWADSFVTSLTDYGLNAPPGGAQTAGYLASVSRLFPRNNSNTANLFTTAGALDFTGATDLDFFNLPLQGPQASSRFGGLSCDYVPFRGKFLCVAFSSGSGF